MTPDNPIIYKRLEPVLIAGIKTRVENRDQILPILDHLRQECRDFICDDPMIILYSGAVRDGILVEAAFPVSHPVETDEIHSRLLDSAPALVHVHIGSHQSIRNSVLKIYEYLDQHAWTTSLIRREIYREIHPDEPDQNVTEVQVILHEWDCLLGEGVEHVLGREARQTVMQGADGITPATTFQEYVDWIRGAMDRLDSLTNDDEKKCRAVSHCAHVFPQERIDHLRVIYQNDGVDGVLKDMRADDFWYEKPIRVGNEIHMRKNPYDPEGYVNGATTAERRKAYCHCSFVHPFLEEIPSQLSPTFCFCGAGWYRRLWEGILGQVVRIHHVETLLRGNEKCSFVITLPLDMTGAYPD